MHEIGMDTAYCVGNFSVPNGRPPPDPTGQRFVLGVPPPSLRQGTAAVARAPGSWGEQSFYYRPEAIGNELPSLCYCVCSTGSHHPWVYLRRGAFQQIRDGITVPPFSRIFVQVRLIAKLQIVFPFTDIYWGGNLHAPGSNGSIFQHRNGSSMG